MKLKNLCKISDASDLKRVKDSDDLSDFVLNLVFNKTAECPKTGHWEYKENAVFNNGRKVASISSYLSTGLHQLVEAIRDFKPLTKDEELDISYLLDFGISPRSILDEFDVWAPTDLLKEFCLDCKKAFDLEGDYSIIDDLLQSGISSEDVCNELQQWIPTDIEEEFVEDYKSQYLSDLD